MKKNYVFSSVVMLSLAFLTTPTLTAQNIGINANGAAPDAGAMLDISSTTKGLLIPRVNITNLNNIAPITGSATVSMLVYNTNATTGQGYYYWNGTTWVRFFTGDPLVDNGLYYNIGASRVRLGGPLVENTTITQGGFGMTWNLSGTGDFTIQDASTDVFEVRDNGNTYFGSDVYWNDASTTGTTLMSLIDDGDDGRLRIYENGAVSVDLDANTQFIFNEQGLDRNFRIESNNQANIFFVDGGLDRIGIRTNTPANMLQMTNGGVNVGAYAMASFDNLGADGVALSGYNQSTASGYNGIEGITNYSGTGFTPAGVFGLAINGSLTHRAIGVRGAANGRDGIGVVGSRQNTGGVVGWGGLFLNDLGYTGFFGAASDKRLKRNINPINNALNILIKLNPVKYYFDLEKYPNMGLNTELEYGFVAQEVKLILPEIVREKGIFINGTKEALLNDSNELKSEQFLTIDYTRLIPITVQAIKEQQTIIEAQNAKIEALEKMVLELQKAIENK